MKKTHYNQGKYRKKSKRRTHRLTSLLFGIASALLVIIICAILFLIHNEKAERDLKVLSAQTDFITTDADTASPSGFTEETVAPAIETTVAATVPTAPQETTEPVPVVLPQYTELAAQNPEMFGWITIEDTKIDYPVMYTPDDPQKYLHKSFEQTDSYPGVPFIDAGCTPDSTNLLIYGHNMPNGTMFRSLIKYQEKNYWQQHPTIQFNTLYEENEYDVLFAFYDRVYYQRETGIFKFYQFIDPESEEEFNAGIAAMKSKALYDTGLTAEYGDKLITLVTCAYHTDHGRFVVVARKK